MAKKNKKSFVTLACEVCKNRNYYINKSQMLKTKGQGANIKLDLQKFCSACRAHTKHLETK